MDTLNPEEIITAIEAVDSLSQQINEKENECLGTIYARFCLLKAKMMVATHVTRRSFEGRPNYWEYWYKLNTSDEFFLMSRELVIEPDGPKLNITFSAELTKGNEL